LDILDSSGIDTGYIWYRRADFRKYRFEDRNSTKSIRNDLKHCSEVLRGVEKMSSGHQPLILSKSQVIAKSINKVGFSQVSLEEWIFVLELNLPNLVGGIDS
jgi:hypothetical protein